MTDHLQNDPDRAGGLVPDAQGEFVAEEAGGVFDPRAFRSGSGPEREQRPGGDRDGDEDRDEDRDGAGPPMNDERMSAPGEEIDKAG
jgi:hypothetical protein